MAKLVYFDFETRSVEDIYECGAARYAEDPSTEILCTGYAINDGPVSVEVGGWIPDCFEDLIRDGYTFVAHNATFEYLIWKRFWGTPPPLKCTMAKASSCGLPRGLERAAKALRLAHEKDTNGVRLINKFSKPKKDGTFNHPEDYPEDAQAFYEYCRQDVVVEREIDRRLPDLSPSEQAIFDLTLKINTRGVCIDRDFAQAAADIVDGLQTAANKRLAVLTNQTIMSVNQVARIKDFLNKNFNLGLTDLQSDTLEGIDLAGMGPRPREIIQLRQEYALASVKKFNRINQSIMEDGRVRDYLVYHGALTGRWSSKIVQFQNIPKGGDNPETCIELVKTKNADLVSSMYEFPITAMSEAIRGVITAAPGKKLVVADYSAIEARVLLWLVGQTDAVKLLATGEDIYVDMARFIYNNPNLTKNDKAQRQLGKQAVLGCGYQMGPTKFKITCAGYGIDVSESLAERAVKAYREKYKRVPEFWSDVEQAATFAYQNPGKRYSVVGKVAYAYRPPFLYCFLPSGRSIKYYCPGVEEKATPYGKSKPTLYYFAVDSQTQNFKKTHTYGGKLTENIVQAIARDIMADAMMRLEDNGFPVVLSVHDEIICEVDGDNFYVTPLRSKHSPVLYDENTNNTPLHVMLSMMQDLPDWAKGCPISAEGWEGTRYRK